MCHPPRFLLGVHFGQRRVSPIFGLLVNRVLKRAAKESTFKEMKYHELNRIVQSFCIDHYVGLATWFKNTVNRVETLSGIGRMVNNTKAVDNIECVVGKLLQYLRITRFQARFLSVGREKLLALRNRALGQINARNRRTVLCELE